MQRDERQKCSSKRKQRGHQQNGTSSMTIKARTRMSLAHNVGAQRRGSEGTRGGGRKDNMGQTTAISSLTTFRLVLLLLYHRKLPLLPTNRFLPTLQPFHTRKHTAASGVRMHTRSPSIFNVSTLQSFHHSPQLGRGCPPDQTPPAHSRTPLRPSAQHLPPASPRSNLP